MALEIQAKKIMMGNEATFTFSDSMGTNYCLGLTTVKLEYGSKDHHVAVLEVQLKTQVNNNTITVTPDLMMRDNSGSIADSSISYVVVTAIAAIGNNSQDFFSQGIILGINDGESSTITGLSSSNIYTSLGLLDGFDLIYNGDHHVKRVNVGSGIIPNGNSFSVTSIAEMNDNSGNSASVAHTIDAGYFISYTEEPGVEIKTNVISNGSNDNITVNFDNPIEKAYVIMDGFNLEFSGHDYHVKNILAGTIFDTDTTSDDFYITSNDNNTSITFPASALIEDNSGHSSSQDSQVSFTVFGILAES